MNLFRRRSPEVKFWDWFAKNQSQIAAIRTGHEPIANQLSDRLSTAAPGLVWEKGDLKSGMHDFVVSADGIAENWTAVRRVVAAAPPIPNWQITAFRPQKEMSEINFQGHVIRLRDISFFPVESTDRGPLNLTFLIPELSGGNREVLIGGLFILLDSLLGEERVMTKLGTMEFIPTAEGDGSERSILELPALLASRE